jgi:Sulfotransferase family
MSVGKAPNIGGTAPGPLFVVSMSRAGSSLLYALLNKHPQVALMFEGDLVRLRSTFLNPIGLRHWTERWDLFDQALTRHALDREVIPNGVSNFPKAFSAAHRLYAQKKGAVIWGDKSPAYFNWLARMAKDFPEARFIIVWRDPTYTANAVLRAAAAGSAHFRRRGAVLREFLGYEILKKQCDRLLRCGVPVCQINYEDLTRETEAVMRRVCDFLTIDYEHSLSTLQNADRSAIFEGSHHSLVRGDTIVQGPRENLISPKLREKINSYVALWRQSYPGWPPYPRGADLSTGIPNRVTRSVDRLLYRIFRLRNFLERMFFSHAPIWLLRRHRERQKGSVPLKGAPSLRARHS